MSRQILGQTDPPSAFTFLHSPFALRPSPLATIHYPLTTLPATSPYFKEQARERHTSSILPCSDGNANGKKLNWPQKERERSQETNNLSSYPCVLCTEIRQNHARSRGFFRAERAKSAEKKRKEGLQFILSPRPLRLCARMFLPAGSWPRHTMPGCGMLLLEQDFLNRREQRLVLYLSSLRCLRFLMFKKCVWLRLAALRSFAAKILPRKQHLGHIAKDAKKGRK